MITYFNMGLVRAQQGITLRGFLSEKLHCDPMRITKKFSGNDCIGKQVFVAPLHDDKAIRKCEAELKKLERIFIIRLVNKSKERPRGAKRALALASNIASNTAASSVIIKKETTDNNSTSTHSSTTESASVANPPKEVSNNGALVPPSSADHVFSSSSIAPRMLGLKGGPKRVNSAPDLASLELFESEDQDFGMGGALCDTDHSGRVRKKRRLAESKEIPRSRSMLSFDNLVEIDDRAAGELLLSFSETLRSNFVALQKQNMAAAAGASTHDLTSLPSFFSSEATSTEAAKYTRGNVGSIGKVGANVATGGQSASAKFLESLSMLQSEGTAASLFPEMSSLAAANNANNSNFSVLEERIPFSSDATYSDNNFDDSFDKSPEGQDDNVAEGNADFFDEPTFFIGTGADIE
jgi:hypothetical protein